MRFTVVIKLQISVCGIRMMRKSKWVRPAVHRALISIDMLYLRDKDERGHVLMLSNLPRDLSDGQFLPPSMLVY